MVGDDSEVVFSRHNRAVEHRNYVVRAFTSPAHAQIDKSLIWNWGNRHEVPTLARCGGLEENGTIRWCGLVGGLTGVRVSP